MPSVCFLYARILLFGLFFSYCFLITKFWSFPDLQQYCTSLHIACQVCNQFSPVTDLNLSEERDYQNTCIMTVAFL